MKVEWAELYWEGVAKRSRKVVTNEIGPARVKSEHVRIRQDMCVVTDEFTFN